MTLEFDVKDVKSGKDRDGMPVVDIRLRTEDFQAMLLSKFILLDQKLVVEVLNEPTNG